MRCLQSLISRPREPMERHAGSSTQGQPEEPLSIDRVTRAGIRSPGFAGPEHAAVEVFGPNKLELTDPFVMLMDDILLFEPGQSIGVAHPHAGLETLTLVLQGALDDADEGRFEAGDAAWMTAGAGVIHNEDVRGTGYTRVLQLWVALPAIERKGSPRLQVLRIDAIPVRREPGAEARLYSGSTGKLVSPTRNLVPMTVVDFILAPGASIDQMLPSSQGGLLYVVEGSVRTNGGDLSPADVAWFSTSPGGSRLLQLHAGRSGARVLLYAGQPLKEPILQHGPFVAGSRQELAAYFKSWSAGAFNSIQTIGAEA